MYIVILSIVDKYSTCADLRVNEEHKYYNKYLYIQYTRYYNYIYIYIEEENKKETNISK